MTSVRASRPTPTVLSPAATALRVRWTMSINTWHDPFDVPHAASQPCHRMVALVLELQRKSACDSTGTLQAWLEFGGHRRIVLNSTPVRCCAARNGASEHVDVYHLDDDAHAPRLLALSIDATGQLRFAQSALLAAAGLRGGTYDPPSISH